MASLPEKVLFDLEGHAKYVQNFLLRAMDHVDPESGPVKGTSPLLKD
jgi:hypothetical protein